MNEDRIQRLVAALQPTGDGGYRDTASARARAVMFLAMYDAVRAYEAEHRPDPHEGQPDPSYVRGQEEMRHRAAEVAGAISVVTHSPYFSSCAELIRNLTVYPR